MYFWFLLAAVGACLVALGFFVVTIFSLQDILEVKNRTEDRLRENQDWLRAIIDNTKNLISVKNTDGCYVMVNRRFESVVGLKGMMIEGRRDSDIFDTETVAALTMNDAAALEQNRSVEFDQTFPVTGGAEPRHYYVVKTPLHDAVGHVTAVCTLASDVTERELARRERDRLFDLSLDLMVAVSFDGYVVLANPQYLATTGFTIEELRSMPGIDMALAEDREAAQAALESLRRGKPLVNFRAHLRSKDGTTREIEWRAMPAVEDGMIYAVGREVTETGERKPQVSAVRLVRR